ncbi:GTPase activator protein [Oryctes borbonicus]|uniref:TBC1 domain family member 30 n=1 Tax=Oryctes borbonicus TaxID=1629725 RepID=A0A0T6AUE9_9SCAR|nr:GTPase activator protein [Oryctes borbonicus]
MLTRQRTVRQLQLCDPTVFGDVVLTCQSPPLTPDAMPFIPETTPSKIPITKPKLPVKTVPVRRNIWKTIEVIHPDIERRRTSALVDQLLVDIYNHASSSTDYNSATSSKSLRHYSLDMNTVEALQEKGIEELQSLIVTLHDHVGRIGSILVRQLKRRDALRRQREAHCDVITVHLRKRASIDSQDMRFSITPLPGESGFSQWHSAMKMVAQLPEGIPPEFRRRLWLTLADRHLTARGIDYGKVERNCFSEWSHPADAELGVQIVKDLHRTGCSLFCGEDGQENQALLKKVLLAYARWNKNVGYCQGFNMLAALILQVTEKCESEALKLMIYLIEGVLPDSYFADSLRGLSVDMAVFRELLRTHLPRLSRHLDNLQKAAKDGTTSYEPPLTNVFTMQWFLTLFCNCLPQEIVLRVWDLILLEGNEILLRTALAIWQALADRIMGVRSADEFYCIMGVLTREMLEFGFMDGNTLIKSIVTIGPLTELKSLRDHYLYNINPWSTSPPPSYTPCEEDDKQLNLYPKERLMLDIGVLKKQYVKLKQRQRQAHIIFSAAVSRQPQRSAPIAMNHLLLGKSAIVPVRRLGPPQGAIPPPRKPITTLQWKDTDKKSSSSSSSDTELCDDPNNHTTDDECEQLKEDNPSSVNDNEALMKIDNTNDSIETGHVTPDTAGLLDVAEDTGNFLDFTKEVLSEPAARTDDNLDDGFDFEKFLEERIRCLKQPSLSSEGSESTDTSSEQERASIARKNSERALEIIHENSLILHRILQCQSRYSPIPVRDCKTTDSTPSPLEFNLPHDFSDQSIDIAKYPSDTELKQDFVFDTCPQDNDNRSIPSPVTNIFRTLSNVESPTSLTAEKDEDKSPSIASASTPKSASSTTQVTLEDDKQIIEIDRKSKYRDILEVSRNLDEKYNTLILNKPKARPSDLTLPPSRFTSRKSPSSPKPDLTPSPIKLSESQHFKKSPTRETPEDISAQKSPSHIYNPFPVRLSTRQNKDVAVKLGLYKK